MESSKEPSESPPVDLGSVKNHFQYKNPGRAAFAQVLATLFQSWLLIELGLEVAMPTIILGSLYKNPAEPLNMNDDQASWFGSIPNFCQPAASLMSGFFQEKFGRKGAMIIVNIPIFIGWMTLYSAQSIYSLYAVAMIMGLCTGLSEAPLRSYIGEIGEPRMRGTLSTISTSCCSIGYGTMYLLGYLFDWRKVALLSSSCSVVTFVFMTQIPESPTWLILTGRTDEARKSLCWLRGWVNPDEVEEEFQALVNYTDRDSRRYKSESTKSDLAEGEQIAEKEGYFKQQLKEIMSKKVLHPLRMIFIMFVITSVATVEGIRPYFISELNMLRSPINPKLFLVSLSTLFFVGGMVNVVFLRRFGKRRIALFSFSVAAVSILSIAVFHSLQLDTTQNASLPWIPIILWMIIKLLSGFCVQILPWQLLCEVFPLAGRGTATGIAAASAHLVISILVKSYPYTVAWLGFSGTMYLYGVSAIFGVVYQYFYLLETEGKSLEQIEVYFTENCDRKEKFSLGKTGKNAGKYNESFVPTE